MKKSVSVFAVLLSAIFFVLPAGAAGENLVPDEDSSIFLHTSLWSNPFGGTISSAQVIRNGDEDNYCLAFGREGFGSWVSPCIDLYPVLSKDLLGNTAGGDPVTYKIEFDLFLSGKQNSSKKTKINTLFRCSNVVSNSGTTNEDGTEFRFPLGNAEIYMHYWHHFTLSVRFKLSDVSGIQTWLFCMDSIGNEVTGMYIDNFSVCRTKKNVLTEIVPDYSGTENAGVAGEYTEEAGTVKSGEIKKPDTTPLPNEAAGKNLLSGSDSDFETQDINWYSFGNAKFYFSGGHSGKGLKMTEIPASWSSPAINVAPYINQPGVYSVGFFVKFEGSNEGSTANLLMRGGSANSFMAKSGANVLATLSEFKVKNNEWCFVSGEFTVKKSDIANKDEWILCIGSISEGTTAITFDDAQLILGRATDLKNINVIAEEESNEAKIHSSVEFDKSIKKAFYVSLVSSVFIGGAVIASKIRKSKKRSRYI